MKKALIIYHKEDNDGVFSAALLYHHLLVNLKYDEQDIELFGTEYNELNQFAKENTVQSLFETFENIMMTDVSFNDANYMKSLYKVYGNKFYWFDHHAPIIKESFTKHFYDIEGIRDSGRSAILCVWKYLYDPFDEKYNERKVPELLRILSAYDSWTQKENGYEMQYARQINKAVTFEYDLKMENILPLIKDIVKVYVDNKPSKFSLVYKDSPLIKELEKTGKMLCEYEDKIYADIIKYTGDKSWHILLDETFNGQPCYRTACVIFHQGQTSSQMFASLKETDPEIMNGVVFKHTTNGNWNISMYNLRDCDEVDWPGRFHCGLFMRKKYKGGGHVGAAGCTITQEQFIKILKKKEL